IGSVRPSPGTREAGCEQSTIDAFVMLQQDPVLVVQIPSGVGAVALAPAGDLHVVLVFANRRHPLHRPTESVSRQRGQLAESSSTDADPLLVGNIIELQIDT